MEINPNITYFSDELLCQILKYLPLKDILSVAMLCKRMSIAVDVHLRLCKSIDFCEDTICGYMPSSITDDHLLTLFNKCPHLETVYGLHPVKIERRRLRKRSALTIPGIIEALSLCCRLKAIETSDLRLFEAIMQHLPNLEIIGRFQNRDGLFPPQASQRLKLQPYPKISSLHLIGVEVPELTAMPHLQHLHLQCVRFTKLQPFRAFLAQNLKTFVMKHCIGPSVPQRYLSLVIALSSSPNLSHLELVRVPLLNGLFQRAVEDSYRHNGFVNLRTLVIAGCKGILEADLGHLMIVSSRNLETLYIQPSLTKDSLFVSLSFAECSFPRLQNLHLGYVDSLNSSGEWSNDALLSFGLAEVPDTPSSITDSGMKVISGLFPCIKMLSVSNCPHLMIMYHWMPTDYLEQPWSKLTDLTLQKCHCLQLSSFALFITYLSSIQVVILNDMFREPPKGCSHVGLSAGTGLGMSSAVVSNQDEHIAVQGHQQDFELPGDDENEENEREFIDVENDDNPEPQFMVLQRDFFDGDDDGEGDVPMEGDQNLEQEHNSEHNGIENLHNDSSHNNLHTLEKINNVVNSAKSSFNKFDNGPLSSEFNDQNTSKNVSRYHLRRTCKKSSKSMYEQNVSDYSNIKGKKSLDKEVVSNDNIPKPENVDQEYDPHKPSTSKAGCHLDYSVSCKIPDSQSKNDCTSTSKHQRKMSIKQNFPKKVKKTKSTNLAENDNYSNKRISDSNSIDLYPIKKNDSFRTCKVVLTRCKEGLSDKAANTCTKVSNIKLEPEMSSPSNDDVAENDNSYFKQVHGDDVLDIAKGLSVDFSNSNILIPILEKAKELKVGSDSEDSINESLEQSKNGINDSNKNLSEISPSNNCSEMINIERDTSKNPNLEIVSDSFKKINNESIYSSDSLDSFNQNIQSRSLKASTLIPGFEDEIQLTCSEDYHPSDKLLEIRDVNISSNSEHFLNDTFNNSVCESESLVNNFQDTFLNGEFSFVTCDNVIKSDASNLKTKEFSLSERKSIDEDINSISLCTDIDMFSKIKECRILLTKIDQIPHESKIIDCNDQAKNKTGNADSKKLNNFTVAIDTPENMFEMNDVTTTLNKEQILNDPSTNETEPNINNVQYSKLKNQVVDYSNVSVSLIKIDESELKMELIPESEAVKDIHLDNISILGNENKFCINKGAKNNNSIDNYIDDTPKMKKCSVVVAKIDNVSLYTNVDDDGQNLKNKSDSHKNTSVHRNFNIKISTSETVHDLCQPSNSNAQTNTYNVRSRKILKCDKRAQSEKQKVSVSRSKCRHENTLPSNIDSKNIKKIKSDMKNVKNAVKVESNANNISRPGIESPKRKRPNKSLKGHKDDQLNYYAKISKDFHRPIEIFNSSSGESYRIPSCTIHVSQISNIKEKINEKGSNLTSEYNPSTSKHKITSNCSPEMSNSCTTMNTSVEKFTDKGIKKKLPYMKSKLRFNQSNTETQKEENNFRCLRNQNIEVSQSVNDSRMLPSVYELETLKISNSDAAILIKKSSILENNRFDLNSESTCYGYNNDASIVENKFINSYSNGPREKIDNACENHSPLYQDNNDSASNVIKSVSHSGRRTGRRKIFRSQKQARQHLRKHPVKSDSSNRYSTRSICKRISSVPMVSMASQGTQATSADIRRSVRRIRRVHARRTVSALRVSRNSSHRNKISSKMMHKVPTKTKHQPEVHHKATSTSDPLLEDDAIQKLQLASNTLLSFTVVSCGVSDLIIDHCPKLFHVEVQACRILKKIELNTCPAMKKLNISQCPKLSICALIDPILSLTTDSYLLVSYEPCMQNYHPGEGEKAILSRATIDQSVLICHDFSDVSHDDIQAKFKENLIIWLRYLSTLYLSLNYNQEKVKPIQNCGISQSSEYPWSHDIQKIHGHYIYSPSSGFSVADGLYQLITNSRIIREMFETSQLDAGFPVISDCEGFRNNMLLSYEAVEKYIQMKKNFIGFYIPITESNQINFYK